MHIIRKIIEIRYKNSILQNEKKKKKMKKTQTNNQTIRIKTTLNRFKKTTFVWYVHNKYL